MKSYLNNNGYNIVLDSITNNVHKKIINDLTVTPYILDASKEELEKSKFLLYNYSSDKKTITIPKYYGIFKFGSPMDIRYDPEDIDLNFTQKLREKQLDITSRCIKYLLRHGGGLLSVPCGFGKTVCALYIAHKLGYKTLVIVHKSDLLKQWMERAIEFLGIDKRRVGIIRQKICDYKNKDIVIGMIQTIAKRDYGFLFKMFGFVIYDEAHHVACKYYSKTLLQTSAQYTLALTATPYRGDGMIKIMYWFIGGTIYREKIKVNKNVIVKIINYKSTDKKLFVVKKKWLKVARKVVSDTTKMTTNLCKINSRNENIIKIIDHIRRNEPERKILILSQRKKHLDILKTGVDQLINDDIKLGLIDDEQIYSCYYTGDTSLLDKQIAAEQGDIIFATYSMANEGLDIKHLNTLIMASPKKDIVQSVGRIMRVTLAIGDVRPMIIDISDALPTIENWTNCRTNIYKKCKYEIENYYLVDSEYKSSSEYFNNIKPKLHHNDYYIDNIINNYNKDMIDYIKDINKYRELCSKIEEKSIDKIKKLYFNNEMENKEYEYHENVEPTSLDYIFFVEKLKEGDIEHQIFKEGGENKDKIDLNDDINLDKEECENYMKKNKNINAVFKFKKKLF